MTGSPLFRSSDDATAQKRVRARGDENFFIAHRVKRHVGGHHQKGKRRKEGDQMKRAIVLALVLLAAVAAPLSGVAYAGTNTASGTSDFQSP